MDHKSNSTPLNDGLAAVRHKTNESAVVEIYGRTGKIYCRMNNLSMTGAFFEITNSILTPRQGDLVRVTVLLKQIGKSHILHGHVIWIKGKGLGISFAKNTELYKKLLK